MEKEVIRYHPLIDGDSSGTDKVPMFLTTSVSNVRKTHSMFLSEMIPNYYKLNADKPMTQKATDKLSIHCPKCGSVLKQIAKNLDNDRLGLYTCDRCKKHN